MLVLARKTGESIRFPELGIEVQVIKTQGRSVSIGIDAPREIKILRGELSYEQNGTQEFHGAMETQAAR